MGQEEPQTDTERTREIPHKQEPSVWIKLRTPGTLPASLLLDYIDQYLFAILSNCLTALTAFLLKIALL